MAPRMPRLAVTPLEPRVNPGGGRFNPTTGALDFLVSLRFPATAADMAQVRTAFEAASQVVRDATDGQHRFGTITLVNNSGGGEAAEFWVHKEAGRADAAVAGYGVRGQHSNLYLPSNFQGKRGGGTGDAYAIAHLFAHQAYGLLDSYAGPNGPATAIGPNVPDNGSLNYSLMDNFFEHGGRANGGTTFTLDEFTVKTNHDPYGTTWQSARRGKSDWETITASKYSATAPTGLPASAAPAFVPVTFNEGTGLLTSELVLDRSGSMNTTPAPSRFAYAKQGVGTYLRFTPDGEQLGLVSFSDAARVDAALAVLDPATRANVTAVVSGLSAGGGTNITAGLNKALAQITSQPRTYNEVIVLLTDGDHNAGGQPEDAIPALNKAGVAVFAVGVGTGISANGHSNLVNLATGTGGRYFATVADDNLPGFLLRFNQEARGNALIAQSALADVTPAAPLAHSLRVEPGVPAVTFVATRQNNSEQIQFEAVSPSGRVYTASTADPTVQVTTANGLVALKVAGPEAGVWTMRATGAVKRVQLVAYGEADGTQVLVTVDNGGSTYPAPVTVRATPQYKGFNITGGRLTATVTRPNGSVVPLALYDDGGASGSGDLVPGDGVYSGRFSDFTAVGPYGLDVSVDAADAVVISGDDALFPGEPPSPLQVPAFTRVGTATAYVGGTVPTTVTPVNLGVTMTGPPGVVQAAAQQTYTATVTNNSSTTAAGGVVATVRLPGGLAFNSATVSQGSFTQSGGVVTFNAGTLAAGGSATVTIRATPAFFGQYRVAATVRSNSPDTLLSDNQSAQPRDNTLPTLQGVPSAVAGVTGTPYALTFSVTDAETASDQLVVDCVPIDPAVLPLSGIVYGGSGNTRTVTLTPAAAGDTVVRLRVTDAQGLSFTRTFKLSVRPNTPPTLTAVADRAVELGQTAVVPLTINDAEVSASSLVLTAVAADPAVLPGAGIVFDGVGANRTLRLTPAALGSTAVTVTVRDPGGLTAVRTFTLTATAAPPPNTPPTLALLADASGVVGQRLDVPLTAGDAETAVNLLAVTATAADATVLPAAAVVTEFTAAGWVLRLTPEAVGVTTVTVRVTDAGGLFVERALVLTAAPPPNTAPTLAPPADATAVVGVPLEVPLAVGDAETAPELLTVTAAADPAVSAAPAFTPSGWVLRLTAPAAGVTTVTVRVTDTGGLSVERTFTLTTVPPNTAPTLAPLADREAEVGTAVEVPLAVGDAETATDLLTVGVTADDPAVAAGTSASYTPAGWVLQLTAGAAGRARLTVTVRDPGGRSAEQAFTLTAVPRNTPPTLAPLADLTLPVGSTAAIPLTLADAETPADRLAVTAAGDDGAVLPATGVSVAGRSLRLTPAAAGRARVTVTVRDAGGLTAERTFTLTAQPVPVANTPPTLQPLGDQTVTAGATLEVPLDFADAETSADRLAVSAASADGAVLPAAGVRVAGRVLRLAPVAAGRTTVTVTVTDPGGQTAARTFALMVRPAAVVPPTLDPVAPIVTASAAGVVEVPLTVGDGAAAADALRVTVTAADPTVLPPAGVQVIGTGASRTLRLTPAAAGTTAVTVTVASPSGATTTQAFTLTVAGSTVPLPPPVKPAGTRQFALGGTGSGNTLRFFNPDRTVRFDVAPFPGFTGQVRTATADFNGDGIADVVVGTGPGASTKVRVLDGATQAELFSIDPFEASFKGGVYVAAGDLTGDGTPELVITPDEGGGPRVRVFTGRGFGAIADFFGIDDTNFRGGARASVGDMNGDGTGDLIVAAGFGGGPRVAIFDGKVLANNAFTRRMTADGQDFFLFEQTLRNGAFVSAGDVTGDGKADLVGGGGPGGGPRVYVLDGASLLSGTTKAVADYFAGDSADRSGVRVAVKDFDADGRGDVLAGIGSGSRAVAYSGPALAAKPGGPDELFALDPFPGSNAGVYVG